VPNIQYSFSKLDMISPVSTKDGKLDMIQYYSEHKTSSKGFMGSRLSTNVLKAL
jgi:hypothetical protein